MLKELHMIVFPPIQVHPLGSTQELDLVVNLQRLIWSYSDLEVEGRSILTVAPQFSGRLLGAFVGGEVVGFSLAFVALERRCLHSHRVGVLPDYQNSGIGRALKLAQREYAQKLGFQSIHWTFDPLQSGNAISISANSAAMPGDISRICMASLPVHCMAVPQRIAS
jgi:predicted GNAT superfamily acetyltransferase